MYAIVKTAVARQVQRLVCPDHLVLFMGMIATQHDSNLTSLMQMFFRQGWVLPLSCCRKRGEANRIRRKATKKVPQKRRNGYQKMTKTGKSDLSPFAPPLLRHSDISIQDTIAKTVSRMSVLGQVFPGCPWGTSSNPYSQGFSDKQARPVPLAPTPAPPNLIRS